MEEHTATLVKPVASSRTTWTALTVRYTRASVPIKKLKFIATTEHAAVRLDHALGRWLPQKLRCPVSKAKVRKLIMAGAVNWNGRPERRAARALNPGVTINAYVDPVKLFEDSTSRDRQFELTSDRILFEDHDLIIVDKPPGLPAQPTLDEARDNLFAAVKRFLSKRAGRAAPYLGVHHRLDRDTSGVVLFTKSQRVNAAIAESFAKREVIKIYQALTVARARVEKEWTVANYLGKVASKSKRAKYRAVKQGDPAETFFRVIAQYPGGIRIEAIPKTGRTHQIRVHLAEYGLPILGDDLYGTREGAAPRLMLHAAELIFAHPITGFGMSIKSPLPDDFRQCLRQIEST
jgi:RluA family pseudouridine synthase